ncbi:AbrB/MazE/SpoVT family DNA-binding domain-containing protein (plasmid) [Sutcliffiella horikoshii]|uniref:AbrB/MazE/SpoVT family DNA-binding domain-containing protein n=1 Tax=Sutcliffiella horikoshii TaxID=79883 RepID=UPI001CBCC238|nr:AbrB/MazE/SpoVT family DNA-binding domain-containing protein [Sutcliffiella horikoshii]UAL49722.1 AbrB/MazE/SpoVT family DNA-binding domain-containing protein [Sutcliffiella horikoshii]
MKATGMVRKVDPLGRIVIPKETRDILGINIKDPLEIFIEEDLIILKKYEIDGACMLTNDISSSNLHLNNGKIIVSRDGADLLLRELQAYIHQTN